jgi:DNA-binding GntR family transcriptional regulator
MSAIPSAPTQLPPWVASRLRHDILEGRIKPGEWLRQGALARTMGVSGMPVREALRLLASEGLLEHVPYKGFRVVAFSPADVEDLYTCRAFIEGLAARHAATGITREQVDELEELHVRMARCRTPQDLAEYRELNRRFHAIIFGASGRSYLVRTLAQLWSAFPTMLWSNIPRVATESVPGREEPDVIEHAAIVSALRAGDPEAAERAVRAHIDEAGRALLSALRRAE